MIMVLTELWVSEWVYFDLNLMGLHLLIYILGDKLNIPCFSGYMEKVTWPVFGSVHA